MRRKVRIEEKKMSFNIYGYTVHIGNYIIEYLASWQAKKKAKQRISKYLNYDELFPETNWVTYQKSNLISVAFHHLKFMLCPRCTTLCGCGQECIFNNANNVNKQYLAFGCCRWLSVSRRAEGWALLLPLFSSSSSFWESRDCHLVA